MIDLHTHTTASDGRCTPAELVARAAQAGVTVLGITDHDTVAGWTDAAAACTAAGITAVPGIEITATMDGADVHVLGYFLDPQSPALLQFLGEQRAQRVVRVRQMIARLAAHGIHLDADRIVAPAIEDPSRAAGRPWIARALVEGGHVANAANAFDLWLARGRPAFVPRIGATPPQVFARIHAAGGVASLAHPVLVARDEWIGPFADAGLDALEAYHSDHDQVATARYLALAERFSLAVSGGSDFHGDPAHGPAAPGAVTLPPHEFARLSARASARGRG